MGKAWLSAGGEGSYIDLRIIRALEATIRSSRVASPGIMSRSAAELNNNQANAVHTNIVCSYRRTNYIIHVNTSNGRLHRIIPHL